MEKGRSEILPPPKMRIHLRPTVAESRYLHPLYPDSAGEHISVTLIFWYACEKYESAVLVHPYPKIVNRRNEDPGQHFEQTSI